MRSLRTSLLALSAAALLASPAFSQPPGGGRGGMQMGGGGIGAILGNVSVQEELKLDDKQKEKAKEFAAKMQEKMQELRGSFQGLSREEIGEKMREVAKTQTEAAEKFMKEVLTPEQHKRAKQIALQQARLMAFTMEDVVKDLKLTDEQKEKIKALGDDMRKDMQELRGSGGDPQEMRQKTQSLTKEYFTKATEILTPDQKKHWAEMTGKPFEMKPNPRPDR
jgi:Spy/CpxP family protein refolding chaperone